MLDANPAKGVASPRSSDETQGVQAPGGTTMRMLLVQPPQGTRFGLSRILTGEPLGLECVGGAVRSRGYDAEVVYLRLDSWDALDRPVDDAPSAVGISCSFTTDVPPSLAVARV